MQEKKSNFVIFSGHLGAWIIQTISSEESIPFTNVLFDVLQSSRREHLCTFLKDWEKKRKEKKGTGKHNS